MAAMPSLRWGLVGTSGYAERVCVPAFANTSTTQLVAVASSNAERATSFAARNAIPHAYAETQALFADAQVDAIWIASSSFLHFDHAAQAIEQGKHVLLEKPIALTAAEG